MYPEIDELGTGKEKEVASLVGTPGLRLLANIGTGPIRCEYRGTNDVLYVVSGNTLYSVSNLWAATSLGTLLTSTGQVSMVDDGFNLIIVDGSNGYDYNFSAANFTQITDLNFRGSNQVRFQGSYFIFTEPDSNVIYLSDLPSGNATDPITFNNDQAASKEGFADNIVGILSLNENIWIFGERTSEVWYANNSTFPDFPFQIVTGAFIQQGCASAFSIAQIDGTIFWLGQNEQGQGVVYMGVGYAPVRVSTHAVEFALQGYATLADAVAFTYQANGHSFYILNFTSAQKTWAFDMATKMWHERAYFNNGVLERHRADNHTFVYETHVVGDYGSGNIYAYDDSVYTDNSNPILRLRTAPHITSGLDRVFYSELQLDVESGVGLDGIQQGTNPQAMLKWSNDGGHSWSNENWAPLGKIGQTKGRALWRRLGAARDRVYSVSISDPVKVIMIDMQIQLMAGAS